MLDFLSIFFQKRKICCIDIWNNVNKMYLTRTEQNKSSLKTGNMNGNYNFIYVNGFNLIVTLSLKWSKLKIVSQMTRKWELISVNIDVHFVRSKLIDHKRGL